MTVLRLLEFLRGTSRSARRGKKRAVIASWKCVFWKMFFIKAWKRSQKATATALFRSIHHPRSRSADDGRTNDGLDPNQKHEVRGLIRRMGEKKAIIFSRPTSLKKSKRFVRARLSSTVDKKSSPNGTPAELKHRSDAAGAVAVRIIGVPAAAASQKIGALPVARRASVVEEGDSVATIRVLPRPDCRNGELARSISELVLKEGWKLEELHTEEGRLDEVFRSITLPDTKVEERK